MSSPLGQLGADVERLVSQLESALTWVVGLGNPAQLAGDPGALRAGASEWRAMAADLRDLETVLDRQVSQRVPAAWTGDAAETFASQWRQVSGKIGRLAGDCAQMADSLEQTAGRLGSLNGEIASVVDEIRGLAGVARSLDPTGLASALPRASGLVDRLRSLVAEAAAALQAMMSWLLALELLFSHELGQLPRVDLRLEPMPLPGGRIGVEPLPQIAVWPRHGTGTRGGPSGNPADLLPLLIAAMIAAGVSLPVIMRWLQGVTAGSGGDPGLVEAHRTYEEWQQWMARAQLTFAITATDAVGTPPPPNDPRFKEWLQLQEQLRLQREARQWADRLGVDPARFERLVFDSDQGKLTDNALVEARVGIRLEQQGQLQGVARAPGETGDLVDSNGTYWDVKTPKPSINISTQIREISRQLSNRRNVIINTQNLTPAEESRLQEEVAARGWSQQVLFGAP